MPATKRIAFRTAQRAASIVPVPPHDHPTDTTQKNLELVREQILDNHEDLERRCNLSFLQLDNWLSEQQSTIKSLQDSQSTTELKFGAHAHSQLAMCTDLEETMNKIQSQMSKLCEDAQLVVSGQFQLEHPKIVKEVIQQMNGDFEKALRKLQENIQEKMKLACLQIQESSAKKIDINMKQHKEHHMKDLEAQLGNIRTTITENHELQNQLHTELAQELKHELDRRCESEMEKLKSCYEQGYKELQARVDGFQEIVNKHRVNVSSSAEQDIQQFKEDVCSKIQFEHRRDVDELKEKLRSLQTDLAIGADMVEENDNEIQKVKTRLSQLKGLIASQDELRSEINKELSTTQMETLRNYLRDQLTIIVESYRQPSSSQHNQPMVDVETPRSTVVNPPNDVDQTAAVKEKLDNILSMCSSLAKS